MDNEFKIKISVNGFSGEFIYNLTRYGEIIDRWISNDKSMESKNLFYEDKYYNVIFLNNQLATIHEI